MTLLARQGEAASGPRTGVGAGCLMKEVTLGNIIGPVVSMKLNKTILKIKGGA